MNDLGKFLSRVPRQVPGTESSKVSKCACTVEAVLRPKAFGGPEKYNSTLLMCSNVF